MDKLVLIDLETTGTNAEMDKIIEVAAIKIENGKIVGEFCSFVDPGRSLTDEIIAITGITDKDLDGAPKIEEVIDKLKLFVQDYPLLAHNMDFDASFLLKAGMDGDFLDSLDLSCILFPLEEKHTQEYLLSNICGVTYNAHRALEDVKNLFTLYLKLLERAKEMDERVKGEIRQALRGSDWKLKSIFDEASDGQDEYLTETAQENKFCPKELPDNPEGIPMAHLMSWLFYTETGNLTEMSYWVRRKYDKFFRDVRVKMCNGADCNYFNKNERLF